MFWSCEASVENATIAIIVRQSCWKEYKTYDQNFATLYLLHSLYQLCSSEKLRSQLSSCPVCRHIPLKLKKLRSWREIAPPLLNGSSTIRKARQKDILTIQLRKVIPANIVSLPSSQLCLVSDRRYAFAMKLLLHAFIL